MAIPVYIFVVFVTNLQVSKVVKSEECADDERAELFEAVGFTFIRRLLKTSLYICYHVSSVSILNTE